MKLVQESGKAANFPKWRIANFLATAKWQHYCTVRSTQTLASASLDNDIL